MHIIAKLEVQKSEYSLQKADEICELVRDGHSLAQISKLEGMPEATRMYAWSAIYPEFKLRLAESKKQRADAHFDKVVDLADTALGAHKDAIPGIKLATDIHKWAAEKLNPDSYGKEKEAVQKGGTSVSITLHTGVLDSVAPTDIIVDEFGNFKGFNNGTTKVDLDRDQRGDDDGGTITLNRDRFKTIRTVGSDSEDSEEENSTEEG